MIRRTLSLFPVILAATAAAGAGLQHQASAGSMFGPPVRLTPQDQVGGYEPSLVVDAFNNVFVTAHKNVDLEAVAPDANGVVPVRSQSWMWTSADGIHFTDPPGLTDLAVDRQDFGDEGDLAADDANHVYFVDTKVVDVALSRWTVTGNGQMTLDYNQPTTVSGEPVDDRPWITAHGSQTVAYFGNEGDKLSYVQGDPANGCGAGRYTVYMSHDGGQTFDHTGCTLPDSGWCRPAADHQAGSQYLYLLCGNDGGADGVTTNPGDPGFEHGTLWAYVSADDGQTWKRRRAGGFNANDSTQTWPSVNVARDGSIYALYNDADTDSAHNIVRNHLLLLRSTDHGTTWQQRDVTPAPGFYDYTWSNVAPDGHTLGIAYYYRANSQSPWSVYGAIAPGWNQPFMTANLAPDLPVAGATVTPRGDFFQAAFGPDNRLNVAWTVRNDLMGTGGTVHGGDIWFARQAVVVPSVTAVVTTAQVRAASRPFPAPLPNTASAHLPEIWRMSAGLMLLVGPLVLTRRRRRSVVAGGHHGRRPARR